MLAQLPGTRTPQELRDLTDARQVELLTEPLVNITLLAPSSFMGGAATPAHSALCARCRRSVQCQFRVVLHPDLADLIKLCESRGGNQIEHSYLGSDRALLRYRLPLAYLPRQLNLPPNDTSTLEPARPEFDE